MKFKDLFFLCRCHVNRKTLDFLIKLKFLTTEGNSKQKCCRTLKLLNQSNYFGYFFAFIFCFKIAFFSNYKTQKFRKLTSNVVKFRNQKIITVFFLHFFSHSYQFVLKYINFFIIYYNIRIIYIKCVRSIKKKQANNIFTSCFISLLSKLLKISKMFYHI